MYDSLSNGQRFQKPKFDYKAYIKNALVSPIKAPNDVFIPRKGVAYSSEDDEDGESEGSWEDQDEEEKRNEDDEEEHSNIPHTFRSRRE